MFIFVRRLESREICASSVICSERSAMYHHEPLACRRVFYHFGIICDRNSIWNNSRCYQDSGCRPLAYNGPCFPRGRNVAIDRSSPLVIKLSDSLPNLVAVSESSSGRTPCSNYDTTRISLAEQTSESSFIAAVVCPVQDDLIPEDNQTVDWRLATYHYLWQHVSRLADFFGFPPGNVAIDRREPLVVKLSDSLPNHVAVSESLSGRRACSNVDTTLLAEQSSENSGVGCVQVDRHYHKAGWQLVTSHHDRPFARLGDSLPNNVAVSESSLGRKACEHDDATLMNLAEQTKESSVIAAVVVGAGKDGLMLQDQHADWRQSTYHYPWPPASRLADLFGFPPGNVAIDRRGPLVVKLSDSLPNHVAVSESLSGQRACSNVDTTQVSLAEICPEQGIVKMEPCFGGPLMTDFFGFLPGNVAIDRRGPLVVKLSDLLPNHVAVSESLSGRRACSNVDTTQVSLAEICPEQGIVKMEPCFGGPLMTADGKGSIEAHDEKKQNYIFLKGS